MVSNELKNKMPQNSLSLTNRFFGFITPNQLTIGRILAIPAIMVLLYLDTPVTTWVAFSLFFLACITDYWDGVLARERGEVTALGKLLDPIADKMLISALLVQLVWMGRADMIPVVLILQREFAVSGLRQVAAIEGIPISAVAGAKLKTIIQMLAVGFLMVSHPPPYVPSLLIGKWVLWGAAAWTLVTGIWYFKAYYKAAKLG